MHGTRAGLRESADGANRIGAAALSSALIGGLFLFVPFMTGTLAICCALACLCSSTPLRPIDRVLAWIGFGFGALNLIGSAALILAVHL